MKQSWLREIVQRIQVQRASNMIIRVLQNTLTKFSSGYFPIQISFLKMSLKLTELKKLVFEIFWRLSSWHAGCRQATLLKRNFLRDVILGISLSIDFSWTSMILPSRNSSFQLGQYCQTKLCRNAFPDMTVFYCNY